MGPGSERQSIIAGSNLIRQFEQYARSFTWHTLELPRDLLFFAAGPGAFSRQDSAAGPFNLLHSSRVRLAPSVSFHSMGMT